MEMKYIMIDGMFPVIFSPNFTHSDMAKDKNVTSAGFIDDKGNVKGYSDSLGMGPKEKDQKIINLITKNYFKKET